MAPLGKAYTLDEFSKLIFAENQYVLPSSVLAIFQTIENSIEIPVFTQTASSHSHSASISSSHSSHKPSSRDRNDDYRHNDEHHFSGKHSSSSKGNTRDRERDSRDHHHGHGNARGRGGRKETNTPSVTAEDWAIMRTFKTTKIETKTGWIKSQMIYVHK